MKRLMLQGPEKQGVGPEFRALMQKPTCACLHKEFRKNSIVMFWQKL